MLKHYLLVGFRNLARYKKQTVFSIFGLAVGFVCFTMSAYWLQYEMTYDSFHSKSDRIYLLVGESKDRYVRDLLPGPLGEYMKENYPEVEQASCTNTRIRFIEEGEDHEANYLFVDSSFFNIFDFDVVSGNTKSLFRGQNSIIISENYAARREQKNASTIKIFKSSPNEKEYNISATVKSWGAHTNFPFDFIFPADQTNWKWDNQNGYIYLLLREGVDVDAFNKKLKKLDLSQKSMFLDDSKEEGFRICPVEKVRYDKKIGDNGNLKFDQIVLFSIAGFFVILCLLFNYLSLFISRIQNKKRELALRIVNGASDKNLFALLSTEFILVLLFSIFIGFILIEWLLPWFMQLAKIEESTSAVYGGLLLYVLGLLIFSLLLALYPIYFFKRDTLQSSLQQGSVRSRNIFRRGVLIFQLIVGIIFLFCTTVFVKQVNYLQKADLGFDRTRLWSFYSWGWQDKDLKEDIIKIEALPEVEAVTGSSFGTFMPGSFLGTRIKSVAPDGTLSEELECQQAQVPPGYFDFFKIKCLEGNLFDKNDLQKNEGCAVINQTAARLLGYDKPIGRIMKDFSDIDLRIIGVVNDICNDSPLEKPRPIVYVHTYKFTDFTFRSVEGKQQDAVRKVSDIIRESIGSQFNLYSMDERYQEYNKENKVFLKLLYLLSFICLLGSFFGIYSMISLACEQRRKEIAVRKVSGAGTGVLMKLFLKEYYILLIVASVIAFPVGYALIKPWLEEYTIQTSVNWWVFAGVFLAVAIVITLIIVLRIWRTLHINPAQELKKE